MPVVDRKSTRLNSSHDQISYAVFCLKKKKKTEILEQKSTHVKSSLENILNAVFDYNTSLTCVRQMIAPGRADKILGRHYLWSSMRRQSSNQCSDQSSARLTTHILLTYSLALAQSNPHLCQQVHPH